MKTRSGRHFIREWREYRHLTQQQLADRIEMSVSNLSQLENFKQGFSDDGLRKLAEALRCEPGHLLMVDPTRDDAIWSIWERASEAEKAQIVAVSKAIVRKAG